MTVLMWGILLVVLVATACNGQSDRVFPFYGPFPFPGLFEYVDCGHGMQLTYNITRDGNMVYNMECCRTFEDGPFPFPAITKIPPEFTNFVIDLTGNPLAAYGSPAFNRLYEGSQTVCPSVKFEKDDLRTFNMTSLDSANIQFQGKKIELTRYNLPFRVDTYRNNFVVSLGECFRAYFRFDVTQESTVNISCSTGRTGDPVVSKGPYRLSQDKPGEPYKIDFEDDRSSFVETMKTTCGLCFEVDETSIETLAFSQEGLTTYIGKSRLYFEHPMFPFNSA
ncbi:hypothetical protein Pmar_PMAR002154 [Perkinsus marinus ATCC 50983]|uniref:Uncharacterized protein n=1 Tax=Perkinsus marinus (strain ATCC 50983 / TXsc) TaxID=423536 RepID=C5KP98_PERM5|nr:hypothetical protein Pmar_PMAR002154 [Perkinsus marinus ATCC 50983]EER13705.1 hypothetical protein Pmar_PMAR002154 [Perkinsus marinus ATCC 50983]|eukprot:XP_002781910.1 hypothetical protein Pmar_PMAR002154 [Perkinsus marinus ATCC 50983]